MHCTSVCTSGVTSLKSAPKDQRNGIPPIATDKLMGEIETMRMDEPPIMFLAARNNYRNPRMSEIVCEMGLLTAGRTTQIE